MLEARFFKAPPGCDIAPLNDGIDSMQVIPGKCQGGETCDRKRSQPLVPILWVTDDDAYFTASMGRINRFERTVTDQRLVRVHREDVMLGSGKILRIPLLDFFEGSHPLPQIAVDRRIISPMNNCSQMVRWKLVDSQVVHGRSFCIEPPEGTVSGRQEARQTVSG